MCLPIEESGDDEREDDAEERLAALESGELAVSESIVATERW